MQAPPFKLAAPAQAAVGNRPPLSPHGPGCCPEPQAELPAAEPRRQRRRLQEIDPHLHCSIVGTCLSTHELRKVLSRFVEVKGRSDMELHHDGVGLAAEGGAVAKALSKALDQRHELAIRQLDKLQGEEALGHAWDNYRAAGDVPGAYWAVLTHPDLGDTLRHRVFGEVHMLSHLVGSANRADIRRLQSLETEHAELRERAEQQQLRAQQLLAGRDDTIASLQSDLAAARCQVADAGAQAPSLDEAGRIQAEAMASSLVALQTERREKAEQALAAAQEESLRLRAELEQVQRHLRVAHQELGAAETQLQEIHDARSKGALFLSAQLRGRRILYVGGRPSSSTAIRHLVFSHGGELSRHDGGLEDRKGMLAAAVAAADLVVFPVDCIDHDSANNLKRLCSRQGIDFLPLRSASVTSFAAALSEIVAGKPGEDDNRPPRCFKHG